MRRKKASDAPLPVAGVDNDDRVKVVERREYVQRITQAPQAEKPTIEILAAPVEDDGDDLLDFLAELEEEIGLSLRVDRLPQYGANGKWNKGASFEFCDNIPINKSDLKSGMYMAVIRDLFGPAAYRCTLREVGAGIIRSWPIKIAAPMQQASQPRQPGSSVIYQQQAPNEPLPQRDTLQELVDAGEKVSKLQKLFGWQREAQQAPVTITAPATEEKSLADKVVEALTLRLVEKGDEGSLEKVADLLVGKRETGWADLLMEAGKTLLPLAQPIAAAIIGRMMQVAPPANGQPVQQGQPAQLAPMQPPPQQAPMMLIRSDTTGEVSAIPITQPIPPNWSPISEEQARQAQMPQPAVPPSFRDMADSNFAPVYLPQPAQPTLRTGDLEDENEMAENDLMESLVDMLDDCTRRMVADPKVIEVARAKIAEFKRNFPQLDQFIGMLITMPPQAVLGLLAMQYRELAPLITNPIAVQVITDLQAAIKPEQVQ